MCTAVLCNLRGLLCGESVTREALDPGISIVTQELNPIPQISIAENIFIGREPVMLKGLTAGGLVQDQHLHLPHGHPQEAAAVIAAAVAEQ